MLMLNVVMLIVSYAEYRNYVHYPESHNAECRYPECRGASNVDATYCWWTDSLCVFFRRKILPSLMFA
jgi:hypothetical protein